MARRTSNKIEPAPMTIALQLPVVLPGGTFQETCDLSQIASIVNRRFYRQGLNWAVAGFKFISDQNFRMFLKKLPNTWVLANSWEKSMKTWLEMTNKALKENESVRPRFMDFKVYADSAHHNAGYVGNLLPYDGFLGTPYVPGEWESAKLSIPLATPADPTATAEREIIAVGANYPGNSAATGLNAVSMIEGYASSRGLPNVLDPNRPDDADDASGNTPQNWMTAVFNEGTDQSSDVLEILIDENNIAPYPFENDGVNLDTMYPGGANQAGNLQLHDFVTQTSSSIGAMSYAKGGNFPCGLVRFTGQNDGTGNMFLSILIDLVPGTHRGYLAEPMTEM